MRHPRLLDREGTVVLVIDMQEAYRPVLHGWSTVEAATCLVVEGARTLGLPLVVTEQYPKGLGRTSERIRTQLGPSALVIEKSSMSCCGQGRFMDELARLGRPQLLVTGIEAHACVNQTVLDLIANGYQPHVARDATSSRHPDLVGPAWEGMLQAGMRPTTAEQALLELVQTAESNEFRALQGLLKTYRA